MKKIICMAAFFLLGANLALYSTDWRMFNLSEEDLTYRKKLRGIHELQRDAEALGDVNAIPSLADSSKVTGILKRLQEKLTAMRAFRHQALGWGDWTDFILDYHRLQAWEHRIGYSARLSSAPVAYLPAPDSVYNEESLEHLRWLLRQGRKFLFRYDTKEVEAFKAACPSVIAAVGRLSEINPALCKAALHDLKEFRRFVTRDLFHESQQGQRKAYISLLRNQHFLDETPEEIARIGRRELKDALAKIQAVSEKIAPGQSWRKTAQVLRRESPLDADEMVRAYRQNALNARDFVYGKNLFTHDDFSDHFDVKAGNPEAADKYPFGYYNGPAHDDATLYGQFTVIPPRPDWPEERRRDRLADTHFAWMKTIAAHELIPGHHLHHCITRVFETNPNRLNLHSSVTLEGWGLYSETLLIEYGFSDDAKVAFAQLQNYLWRCCRAVIDPELHTGKTSWEEAVVFMMKNTGFSRTTCESEANRFLDSPTQPMGYLLGCLKIRSLREKYLGKFPWKTVKNFHDEFLASSPIPMALIECFLLDERPDFIPGAKRPDEPTRRE